MDRIFYCDPCGDERSWPRQMVPLKGRCQICGEECMGNHTPRSVLPTPPTLRGQLRFKFDWNERPS